MVVAVAVKTQVSGGQVLVGGVKGHHGTVGVGDKACGRVEDLGLGGPLAVAVVQAGGMHAEGVDELASLGGGLEVRGSGGGVGRVVGGHGTVGVVDKLGGGARHQQGCRDLGGNED